MAAALPGLDVDVVVTVTPALLAAAVQLLPDGTILVHQEHRSSADRVGGMEPLLAFAPRADVVATADRVDGGLAGASSSARSRPRSW